MLQHKLSGFDKRSGAFLERVRRSLSHDLRTPLGAIVNYAAVLESGHVMDHEAIADLSQRIRSNAACAARMVQGLATASELASRPLHFADVDVLLLARSVLDFYGGSRSVKLGPGSLAAVCDVDAEIVGFAWKAFVAALADARNALIAEAQVSIACLSSELLLDFECGDSGAQQAIPRKPVTLQEFLIHGRGSARTECAMGLGLAEAILEAHGGALTLIGTLGTGASMRLSLPKQA